MPVLYNSDDDMVLSYKALRKTVGFLAFSLPIVLWLAPKLLGGCSDLQASISHYYYTIMNGYFVGTLCAVSLFLFFYQGYSDTKKDRIASFFAAIFALGVAFFPTDRDPGASCEYIMLNGARSFNTVHYVSAALLFGILAYFCLGLFTKSSQAGPVKGRKKIRNGIYIVCGSVIIICIGMIGIYHFADGLQIKWKPWKPVFVFETLALFAFGISWIVKGETVLADK